MTNVIAAALDVDHDARWRQWQAKGAAQDRRTARRMRLVLLLIIITLMVWSYVQLT